MFTKIRSTEEIKAESESKDRVKADVCRAASAVVVDGGGVC